MISVSSNATTRINELSAFLFKTERILKIIEQSANEMYLPIMIEWRYATLHLVRFLEGGFSGDTASVELDKALSHVKRSYFDSLQILMESFLSRAFCFAKVAESASKSIRLNASEEMDGIRATMRYVYMVRQDIGFNSGDSLDASKVDWDELVVRIDNAFRIVNLYLPVFREWQRYSKERMLRTVTQIVVFIVMIVVSFFIPRWFHWR